MWIFEDTNGFWWWCSWWTLLLASFARLGDLAGVAGLLLGAVSDDMGPGMTAVAYVWVAAVTAPAAGWLVEVEAHCLGSTQFSVGVSRRTDVFSAWYGLEQTLQWGLRVLWIYAPLQNAELVRKEEALYLRFFTQELKNRKFWISCCARDWTFKLLTFVHCKFYMENVSPF